MIESKIQQMIQAMSAKGLRITEQRRSLARLFAEFPRFYTAMEVYESLESKHEGLSYDTVYRNLRMLREMGVLEQFHFEEGIKFRMGCFDQKHHHHHLVCLTCDRIYPLDYCPMPFVAELPDHFQVVHHTFEVYGYCPSCSQAGADVQQTC